MYMSTWPICMYICMSLHAPFSIYQRLEPSRVAFVTSGAPNHLTSSQTFPSHPHPATVLHSAPCMVVVSQGKGQEKRCCTLVGIAHCMHAHFTLSRLGHCSSALVSIALPSLPGLSPFSLSLSPTAAAAAAIALFLGALQPLVTSLSGNEM
jgi:hypothetical protein